MLVCCVLFLVVLFGVAVFGGVHGGDAGIRQSHDLSFDDQISLFSCELGT